MELTPELLGAGVVGLLVIFSAVGSYINGRRNAHKLDPVTAGVAGGFVDHDLMRQLVDQVKRCADALERLADKKQDEMRETLEEIADELKRPRRRS
jgi:hypothetical protein